jgi:hypothetical protein
MLEIIQPIIIDVYGDTAMARALAENLAERVENADWRGLGDYNREDSIRNICWDWMTGGDTAQYTAERVERALQEAGL